MAFESGGKKLGKNTPVEVFEYQFCKEFGWTLDELYAQPFRKIERFAVIMRVEGQLKEYEQSRAESELTK